MRTRPCTPRTVAGRLAKAEEFQGTAELLADDPEHRNAAASLFVDAGIAAADVLCCRTLGEHAQGQDHNEAITLLARVDRDRSGDLRTLLSNKSRISYSERALPDSVLLRVQRAATRLVEAARAI